MITTASARGIPTGYMISIQCNWTSPSRVVGNITNHLKNSNKSRQTKGDTTLFRPRDILKYNIFINGNINRKTDDRELELLLTLSVECYADNKVGTN